MKTRIYAAPVVKGLSKFDVGLHKIVIIQEDGLLYPVVKYLHMVWLQIITNKLLTIYREITLYPPVPHIFGFSFFISPLSTTF